MGNQPWPVSQALGLMWSAKWPGLYKLVPVACSVNLVCLLHETSLYLKTSIWFIFIQICLLYGLSLTQRVLAPALSVLKYRETQGLFWCWLKMSFGTCHSMDNNMVVTMVNVLWENRMRLFGSIWKNQQRATFSVRQWPNIRKKNLTTSRWWWGWSGSRLECKCMKKPTQSCFYGNPGGDCASA